MRTIRLFLCIALFNTIGCVSTTQQTRKGQAAEVRGYCSVPSVVPACGLIVLVLVLQPIVWWRRRLSYATVICTTLVMITAWSWFRTLEGSDSISVSWRAAYQDKVIGGNVTFYSGGGCCNLTKVGAKFTRSIIGEKSYQEIIGLPNPILSWSRNSSLYYPLLNEGRSKGTPIPWWQRSGFQFVAGMGASGFDSNDSIPASWSITIPHWFLALLLSIIPAFWLQQAWRLRNRRKSGHCLHCNYDLRATPDAGTLLDKCPECGTPRVNGAATPAPHPSPPVDSAT